MVYDHESMSGGLRPAVHVHMHHAYFRIRTLGQSATEGFDGLGAVRFATRGLDTVLFVAAPCAKPPVFIAHAIRRPPTCGV